MVERKPVLHRADESGRACDSCGISFGRLTVPPGSRVESFGVEPGVSYQTWHPLDEGQPSEAESCADILRGDTA